MTKLQDVILRDITANRPAAGTAGRLFFDTTLVKMQRDNGSSWDDVEGTGGGGGGSLTSAHAEISGDTSASVGAWDDVASLSLAAGTWMVWGKVCIKMTFAGAEFVGARLYDSTGSTELDSSNTVVPSQNYEDTLTCFAIVVLGATHTVKIQGQVFAGSGTYKLHTSSPAGSAAASRIVAVQIA